MSDVEQLLASLDEKEREATLKILKEYANNGISSTYESLVTYDFKELPTDIITFIKDPKYLGHAWHLADGTCKLYPFWEDKLQELFPDPYTTNFNNFIESGARGLGKSEIAITCGLYLMHRLMCLKNPHEYLNLKPTEKVAFAFMNITKILAEEIGISKFQATVKASPWFMERGTMTQKNNEPYWLPPDFINIIIGSQSSHVIGQPIYFAFFDEISFIRNKDIEKQKQIAMDMIDTAIGGMKTRFLHEGNNPTLMVLASSKRSDKSFLEEHMKKKLSDEDANALIIDEPVWNVKPANTYSGKKFYVAQGNKFLASEIIPDDVIDRTPYLEKGYKVLEVPIEFKTEFKDDIDRALCDFAGVSSSNLTKYISGVRLTEIRTKEYQNLFIKDVIEVGDDPKDTVQYSDFIDLTRLDPKMKGKPLFIHLDMSISGDKTGIAGTWILGKLASSGESDASKEVYFKLAFSVSIQAPKGHQISFAKNREFIYWLKKRGFNIKGVSTDTYQNASLAQELLSKGYPYEIISVDRVNPASHVCEPYAYFKNVIYEHRLQMYENLFLTTEILGLERNASTGKIDHPDEGRSGCFTGDTKISLVDDRQLTLLELVEEFKQGKTNYVYSFNEQSKIIEPKLIQNAWCTIKDAKLVAVTLDNNEIIRCTPNHKFMLRDGSYKEAKDLQKNDSLMPLYRKYPLKSLTKNYKVQSVVYLDYSEDVYDLTIEDNHNFALAAGVFVHNSKDQCDAVCGSIWNASKHADEFAFEYGEDLELSVKINQGDPFADKQALENALEEELKKLNDPLGLYAEQQRKIADAQFLEMGVDGTTYYNSAKYLQDGIVIF